MEEYVTQLLSDIDCATENIYWPFLESELSLHDWISPEEEDRTAPVRALEEWTGIRKEQLPPSEMLTENQVHRLLGAMKKMLDACNWSFVLQTEVPQRIQYATIRTNFNQQIILKCWHQGFFELCRPGTKHKECSLGEYCQCAFYAELFADVSDEESDPEEERIRMLEIEIRHLKRKYGNDWKKYYPYHLDPNYDDPDNPDDHERGSSDQWWRK